jgi:hypothetical protein
VPTWCTCRTLGHFLTPPLSLLPRLMSAPDVVLNGVYGRTVPVNQLGPDMAFAHTLLNSGFANKVCW